MATAGADRQRSCNSPPMTPGSLGQWTTRGSPVGARRPPGGGPGVKTIARGAALDVVERTHCRRQGHGDLVLDLPPANTKRWVSRRKAAVVVATRAGLISREEACEPYPLSPEELAIWEAAFDQGGVRGLRVTWHRVTTGAAGRRRGQVPPVRK